MRPRFRALAATLAVLGATGGLTACADPDKSRTEPAPQEFCDAFTRLDDKLGSGTASEQDQYELWTEAVRVAPDQVKADGQKVLEGYDRLRAGEPADQVRKDEAAYKQASVSFQRWGNQHCGFYKRKSSI